MNDAQTFWWYASQFRKTNDRLAFLALIELKNKPNIHPAIVKRIEKIESHETESDRSLRSASI